MVSAAADLCYCNNSPQGHAFGSRWCHTADDPYVVVSHGLSVFHKACEICDDAVLSYAADIAKRRSERKPRPLTFWGLSERQRKILALASVGASTAMIAAELFLSPATVKRDLRNIFRLLEVANRPQAIAEALRRRLI